MYRAIEDYIANHGIKRQVIAERLGVSMPTLRSRLDGTSDWKASEILALSKWWGVPAGFLLSEEDK